MTFSQKMSNQRLDNLYKYLSPSTAKIVLSSHSFRWASPRTFNDIFDVLREFAPGISGEDYILASSVHKFNRDIMPSGKELDPEILRRVAKAVLREHEVDSITNDLETERAHWEQWIDDLRIFCMSELNDLATMWAHYAIDHKGVVLSLDFRDDAHEMAWQIAKKVNYTDEQCSSASLDGLVEDYANYRLPNHFDETCLIKKLEWKNEREWRAVTVKRTEESGLFSDWSYDPSAVLALYLGINMDEDDKDEIVKMFRDGYPHGVIYQACASPPDKIDFEIV